MRVRADKEGKQFIRFAESLGIKNFNMLARPCVIETKQLEGHGFKLLTTGGFKSVWTHDEYPNYVLKIYHTKAGHTKDSGTWPDSCKKLRKHYLIPIYYSPTFMIQHKARKVRLTNTSASFMAKFPDNMDIFVDNIGKFKGQMVIIDFIS